MSVFNLLTYFPRCSFEVGLEIIPHKDNNSCVKPYFVIFWVTIKGFEAAVKLEARSDFFKRVCMMKYKVRLQRLCISDFVTCVFKSFQPQCSSFPVDYYSMIGLGGTYRRLPHWNPTPAQGHLPDNRYVLTEGFLKKLRRRVCSRN